MSSRRIITTCVQFLERRGWPLSRIASSCGCTVAELGAMAAGRARVPPVLAASLVAFMLSLEADVPTSRARGRSAR